MPSVCFTGRGVAPLGTFVPRDIWEGYARAMGWDIHDKVHYYTSYLVASRTDTTKAVAARARGATIITYAEFYQRYEEWERTQVQSYNGPSGQSLADRYGVTLDVQGRVTGFELTNNGQVSEFRINAENRVVVFGEGTHYIAEGQWGATFGLLGRGGRATIPNGVARLVVEGNTVVYRDRNGNHLGAVVMSDTSDLTLQQVAADPAPEHPFEIAYNPDSDRWLVGTDTPDRIACLRTWEEVKEHVAGLEARGKKVAWSAKAFAKRKELMDAEAEAAKPKEHPLGGMKRRVIDWGE